MSASAATVASLRQMLAARFPQAERPTSGVLPTGIPTVDDSAGGGLPPDALCELVCPSPSSGGPKFV